MNRLYDRIGGQAAVDTAVESFYRKLLSDDRISHFFDGVIEPTPGVTVTNVENLAFGIVKDPADWQVYLCGDPQLVKQLKKRFFLASASMESIYSDPFVIAENP
jgi:hypothetical protein